MRRRRWAALLKVGLGLVSLGLVSLIIPLGGWAQGSPLPSPPAASPGLPSPGSASPGSASPGSASPGSASPGSASPGSSPSPALGGAVSTCQLGQLCVPSSPAAGAGAGGQVFTGHDPPSHFARALLTMSVMAIILGMFFVMALTGRVPSFLAGRSKRQR